MNDYSGVNIDIVWNIGLAVELKFLKIKKSQNVLHSLQILTMELI